MRSGRVLVILLALISAVLGPTVPASAASTGNIKGTITSDTTDAVLPGMKVDLQRASPWDHEWDASDPAYKPYRTTTSKSNGTYTFTGLTVDPEDISYVVRVSDPAGLHRTTRLRVPVKKGKTVTANLALKDATIVTGKVTRADGGSPSTLEASLYPFYDFVEPEFVNTVKVKADGSYRFVGLWPGTSHTLYFHDTSGTYSDRCYKNVAIMKQGECAEDVTHVVPEVGSLNPLEDQVLTHLAARVAGTVTDTNGNPIKGINVVATRVVSTSGKPTSTTYTQGSFSIRGLTAAPTYVVAVDPARRWATQWYDHATTAGTGDLLDLTEGESRTGLQFELKSRTALTVATTRGSASAKFAVTVKRVTTGLPAYGSVTVTSGDRTKTVALVGGKATVTLFGLTSANKTYTVHYFGSPSTAEYTKSYNF